MLKWKERIGVILVIFVVSLVVSGVEVLAVEATPDKGRKSPTKITLNYKKKNVSVGDTFWIKVKKVKPKGAEKSVVWTSTNKKIATVNAKGKVKAKKSGNVTIVAKSKKNKKVIAKCNVKVYKATKKLKLITKTSYSLAVGEQQRLSAVVAKPKKGASPVVWNSSNERVATVSKKGLVKAVSQGITTIWAKSGKKKVKTQIVVTLHSENKKEVENDIPSGSNVASGGEASSGNNAPSGSNPPSGGDASSGNNAPSGSNPPSGGEASSGNNTSPGCDSPSGGDTSSESGDTPGTQESEEEVVYSGTQDGISWTLDVNGNLHIGGKSTKECVTEKQLPSWCAYAEYIKTAVVTAEEVKSTYGWFWGCNDLTSVDFSRFYTQYVTDMGSMFLGCSSLVKIDAGQFDTSNVTDMSNMFAGCSNLTSVNIKGFDTSKVTDMSGMFWLCTKLSDIYVREFDTANVRNMKSMFENCSQLTSIEVQNFQTQNVTDMSFMFSGCRHLISLDVSGFDTESVTNLRGMFQSCEKLASIDVTNFQTEKVTDMGYMFSCCKQLTSVNTSGFDMGQVRDIEYMFQGCDNLYQ